MKKRDIILLLGILMIALILFVFINFLNQKGQFVKVVLNNQVYGVYSLDEDYKCTIYSSETDYNILVIEDGYAYVENADCPDQLCVHQKKISKQNEMIVCLPHKLVITIVSEKESTLDGVTY